MEKENVMAVGDYYNDTEMFRAAGISVAVKNAPEDITAVTTTSSHARLNTAQPPRQ